MKRYALILALVMALAAGFGCAKKTQDATGDVDDMSPEMRAAIQQITDGRVLFAFDKFDIQPQYKDMLTAKAESDDRVLGLDSGANDYLTKPFAAPEVLARIRAMTRTQMTQNTSSLSFGTLSLNQTSFELSSPSGSYQLTNKEFEILCLLVENRGIVLSRDKILDKVWQDTMGRESRTVDVHIRTLRHKLGTIGGRIETVRGVGYKFKAEE